MDLNTFISQRFPYSPMSKEFIANVAIDATADWIEEQLAGEEGVQFDYRITEEIVKRLRQEARRK